MSLLELARADFARLSQDENGGFAETVILRSPAGRTAQVKCIFTEVGASFDPTGMTITASAASVAFAEDALVKAGLGIPVDVQVRTEKPWLITVTRIDGTSATYKLTEPRRDRRLGSHWFVLVPYQET